MSKVLFLAPGLFHQYNDEVVWSEEISGHDLGVALGLPDPPAPQKWPADEPYRQPRFR